MARSSMKDALVPEDLDDFRSVQFWDGFFRERGGKAFEWYGDWRQLKTFFTRDCRGSCETLVVGCGNSELSADLYDSGCQQITNIDFSKLVIAAMMRKNLRQRPKMKWQVGDMTSLKFADGSFDVVVDKGGLDALMGEDSAEGTEAGRKLLAEVSRVLAPEKGVYLCVTLAQSHVLELILEHFGRGWSLEIVGVPPSPDMARSPLQPIFVRAQKVAQGTQPTNYCAIKRCPGAPNAEQLEDICQMLEGAASRAAQQAGDLAAEPNSPPTSQFDQLQPGRRVCSRLPYDAAQTGPESGAPRFSATILDVAGRVAEAALQSCCVFLVPQGRETEWLFAAEEGQWQVAGQCSCRRVILVTLGRGHSFGTSAQVQAEISPLCVPLAPLDCRHIPGAIPIMTTQEGVGHRRVVEEVESSISGRVVVEDVAIEQGEDTSYVRRMVFVSNSNLVQSEAVLMHATAGERDGENGASSGAGEKAGGTGRCQKGRKKKAAPAPSSSISFEGLALDHSVLAMEYHKHIIAGLSCSGCLEGGGSGGSGPQALVVGLGGGGLPVFLQRFLGVSVTSVELDQQVVQLAASHFGCQDSPNLQVRVGDGLVAVAEGAAQQPSSLDCLIVDAGSSDATLAMSCPPAPFLQPAFLKDASAILKPGGVLVLNCVTRSQAAFDSALKAVQAVFQHTSFSDVDEDVNRVIFAAKDNASLGKQKVQQFTAAKLRHNVEVAADQRLTAKQLGALVDDLAGFRFQ